MAPRSTFSTDGVWHYLDSADEVSTDFAGLDFDDTEWPKASGLSSPEKGFRRFRRRFRTAAAAGERSWLIIENTCSDANVWFDGTYLGDVDGCMTEHAFEVTRALEERDDHVVSLQIPAGTHIAAAQDVRIVHTGAVRMRRFKVLCIEASADRATLTISTEIDARAPSSVHIRAFVSAPASDHTIDRHLARGSNRLQWNIVVEKPNLWWPRGLGAQTMTNLTVEVSETQRPHQISDRRSLEVGIRDVGVQDSALTINGERLPLETDTEVCGDENSVLATVSKADQSGSIVVQRLPDSAKRVRQTVEALGHHPSFAAWIAPPRHRSWGRVHTDPRLYAATRADPTRPAITESALQPIRIDVNVRQVDGDSHEMDVYVRNDLSVAGADGVLTAVVAYGDDVLEWQWGGHFGARSSTYVATIPAEIPEGESVELDFELRSSLGSVRRKMIRRADSFQA